MAKEATTWTDSHRGVHLYYPKQRDPKETLQNILKDYTNERRDVAFYTMFLCTCNTRKNWTNRKTNCPHEKDWLMQMMSTRVHFSLQILSTKGMANLRIVDRDSLSIRRGRIPTFPRAKVNICFNSKFKFQLPCWASRRSSRGRRGSAPTRRWRTLAGWSGRTPSRARNTPRCSQTSPRSTTSKK